jgi:hypothetical protein
MQRGEWTFDGAGEVTVNIFSIHANEHVVGQPMNKLGWLRNQKSEFEKFFAKQPTYQDWQGNYGMALVTFAQLIRHFGWRSMYEFMREYEEDIKARRSLPYTNQDKIDQWVVRYSRIVGRNIRPHFEMFGLPVTAGQVDEKLAGLEMWSVEAEKDPELFLAPL